MRPPHHRGSRRADHPAGLRASIDYGPDLLRGGAVPDVFERAGSYAAHRPVERQTRVHGAVGIHEERIRSRAAGEDPLLGDVVRENPRVEVGPEPTLGAQAQKLLAHHVPELAREIERIDRLILGR